MNSLWPNGKRVAVAVTVMYETWSEGKSPSYGVQATHLRPGTVDHAGIRWASYGGRVGVWRIINTLDRLGIKGTFFTNAACAELYPDSVKQIVASGHDIGGHAYYQDQLLAYMTLDEQRDCIGSSLDVLERVSGKRPKGWLSPVLASTPETAGMLKQAGLDWHADVTYTDFPHRIETEHGPMAAVPNSDFTDNRVLRSSTLDLFDVHSTTFDYLNANEPMSLLALTLHCQFGGRPMVIAAFDKLIRYIAEHDSVWFTTHDELAQLALGRSEADLSYRDRYFSS